MILTNEGVYTQKIVDGTLNIRIVYENGVLKVKANEKIRSAIAYDGTTYYEIGDGIKVSDGIYEITVVSKNGQTVTQVIAASDKSNNVEPEIEIIR
jgi:flagellar hook assembly protein FlgD